MEEATGTPFKTYCGKDQAMLSSDISCNVSPLGCEIRVSSGRKQSWNNEYQMSNKEVRRKNFDIQNSLFIILHSCLISACPG
jgi:hypothetical protein